MSGLVKRLDVEQRYDDDESNRNSEEVNRRVSDIDPEEDDV